MPRKANNPNKEESKPLDSTNSQEEQEDNVETSEPQDLKALQEEIKEDLKKKQKSNMRYPTPSSKESFSSYTFGSAKGAGGMYVYFNGDISTISMSQSKYLLSLDQIESQNKQKKRSVAIELVSNNRIEGGKKTNIKYIRVNFSSVQPSKPTSPLRVLLVSRVTTTDNNEELELKGIVMDYEKYKEPGSFIHTSTNAAATPEDLDYEEF